MPATSGAIRAGRAFVELFADDTRLVRGLKLAQQRVMAFGTMLSSAGRGLLATGTSLLTPFLGASALFARVGDDLDKMAARTGFSVESLSGLAHAASLSGGSLADVGIAIRGMEKKVLSGSKAFDVLGLSVEDLRRMKPEEQFAAIADAIAAVRDPSLRAGLAMQLFEESGSKILPLLQKGSAGMREMTREAERLGLVMTTAESKSAAAYTDALGTLWEQLKMTSAVIGSAVAPLLTDLLKRTQPVIAATIQWVRENRTLLANLFAMAAALTALRLFAGAVQFAWNWGSRLVVLLGTPVLSVLKTVTIAVLNLSHAIIGALVNGITAVASGAAAALGMLLSPIGLLGATLVGLAGFAVYASGAFQGLWEVGSQVFNGLRDTAVAAWGAIGEALARGDILAAAKVLWTGLVLEWTRGTGLLDDWWQRTATFFQDVWDAASTRLASGFVNVIATMSSAWEVFASGIQRIWSQAVQAIVQGAMGMTEKVFSLLENIPGVDLSAQRTLASKAIEGYGITKDSERKQAAADSAARLAEIERQRAQQQGILSADLDRRMEQRQNQVDSTLQANQQALETAQAEFDAAVAAAKTEAQAVPDGTPTPNFDPLLDPTAQKTRTAGTFSSLAERMFSFGADGGDSQAEIAKNTAATAKDVSKMATRGILVNIPFTA